MKFVEIPFEVEPNYDGWRLDRYLQQKLKRASRAQVQRLIRDALVSARPLKAATPVRAGMRFALRRPEIPEPEGLPDVLPVLYDDGRVLVLDKPAGLPVHPTARYFLGTVTSLLGRDHLGPEGRPDPAHRLDRETSGALVCGRGREATRALKLAFSPQGGKAVDKVYLALVEGHPTWTERRIDHPLALTGACEVKIRMSPVAPDHPGAQAAVTHARLIERLREPDGTPLSLVRCTLETGRQHQIRAHLQAEGFPIVGDKIYGPDERLFIRFTEGTLDTEDRSRLRLPRHALHAERITFPHPDDGRPVTVVAPLPPDLATFIGALERL